MKLTVKITDLIDYLSNRVYKVEHDGISYDSYNSIYYLDFVVRPKNDIAMLLIERIRWEIPVEKYIKEQETVEITGVNRIKTFIDVITEMEKYLNAKEKEYWDTLAKLVSKNEGDK